MGGAYTPAHAAACVAMLPAESSLYRALNPANEWDTDTRLLASIEYSLRLLCWSKTKDAEKGRNAPKPVQYPEDRARIRERVRKTDFQAVKERLGY